MSNSVVLAFIAQTAGAVREIGKVDKALKNNGDSANKWSGKWGKAVGGIAAMVGGVAIVDYLVDATKAASEDAAEVEKLTTVIQNNTNATSAQIDAVGGWIDSMQIATGVVDSDLRNSVAKLTTVTNDLGEAQDLTAIAVDVAAANNMSLADATNLVSKAYTGQTAKLMKQHPEWDKNRDGILSSAEALEGLESSSKGAAEAAVTPWQRFMIIIGEIQEAIGTAFMPALEKIGDWFSKPENVQKVTDALSDFAGKAQALGQWFIDNATLVKNFAIAIGILATAMTVIAVVQGIWTVVTGIWSAVTAVATVVGAAFSAVVLALTAPITWIIIAIVALIAIVVLLWKNWDTVTKWIGQAWQWLKDKAVAIFNGIKDFLAGVWNGIVSFVKNTWNGILSWLSGIWENIKTTAANAFNGLKDKVSEAFNNIKTAVTTKVTELINFIKELPGKILKAVGDLGDLLYDKGVDIIQGLIDGVKSMIGKAGDIIGGVIDSINPFSLSVSGGGTAPALGVSAHGGSQRVQYVNINITGGSAEDNAREIKRMLEREDLRVGRPRMAPLRVAW